MPGMFLRETRESEEETTSPAAGVLPTAIRVAGSVGGSIAGSLIAPGPGTLIGGGIGAGIAEYLAEELERYEGIRSTVNPTRVGLETVLGAMPMFGRFPQVKSLLGRAVLRGSQAAGVSAGATALTELVERGELPPAREIVMAAGLGGILGGLGGAVESRALSRAAPKVATEMGPVTVEAASGAAPMPPPWLIRAVMGGEIGGEGTAQPGDIGAFVQTVRRSDQIATEVKEAMLQSVPRAREKNVAQLGGAWQRVVEDESKALRDALTSTYKTGEDTALAEVLIAKANHEGNFGLAADIGIHATDQLRRGGQMTQAAAIFNRLTPEGIVQFGQRTLSKAGKNIDGSTAKELYEEAKRVAAMPEGLDKDIAKALLTRKVEDLVPATGSQKVLEVYRAFLLSGIKTQVVNTVSNGITLFTRAAERVGAAGIEAVTTMGGTLRPREITFAENVPAMFGAWQGAKEGVRRAVAAWNHEVFISPTLVETGKAAIGGQLGRTVRIPFRILGAVDSFFKSVVYASETHRLAFRQALKEGYRGKDLNLRTAELVLSPSSEIRFAAGLESLTQTYQKPLGNVAMKGLRFVKSNPYTQILVPFYTTPINIVKYGLERTPLGLMRTFYRLGKGDLAGAEVSEEMAKGAVGMLMAGMVATAVKEGLITGGGPNDPDARRAMREGGWLPYSFKIGDQYLSYARFEPVSTVMGLTADFVDLFGYMEPEDAAAQVGFAITQNLTNKTMMLGLSRAINAIYEPERFGPAFVKQLAGSVVPTLLKDVAQTMEPTLRKPEGPIQAIQARLPVLSLGVKPLRGIWGTPVVFEETGPERMASPIRRATINNDEATREVARLSRSGLLGVKSPRRSLGKDYQMDADTYDQYVEDSGGEAHRRVLNLVGGGKYQMADDEKKADLIRNTISAARASTRKLSGIETERRMAVMFPARPKTMMLTLR